MKQTLCKTFIFFAVFGFSWLSLSYYFFPIKLAADPVTYFWETARHMAEIKFFISLLFSVFGLFVYERHLQKQEKIEESEKTAEKGLTK